MLFCSVRRLFSSGYCTFGQKPEGIAVYIFGWIFPVKQGAQTMWWVVWKSSLPLCISFVFFHSLRPNWRSFLRKFLQFFLLYGLPQKGRRTCFVCIGIDQKRKCEILQHSQFECLWASWAPERDCEILCPESLFLVSECEVYDAPSADATSAKRRKANLTQNGGIF